MHNSPSSSEMFYIWLRISNSMVSYWPQKTNQTTEQQEICLAAYKLHNFNFSFLEMTPLI